MKTLAVISILAALVHGASAQISFQLDQSSYVSGDVITASWSGRTGGSATDWIGIYPRGVVPDGNPASTDWLYVSGSRSSDVPLESGSVTFDSSPLGAGEWSAFLLADDGYSVLAQYDFIVVDGGDGRLLEAFSLSKSVYLEGESITASWSGLTEPDSLDWIGVYPRGVAPGSVASTIWQYVPDASDSGSLVFNNPGLGLGEWSAFFLIEDGYQSLASVDFSVANPPILGFGADHQFIDDSPIVTLSWVINPGETVTSLTIDDGTTTTDVLGLDTLDVQPDATTTYTLTLNGGETATTTVFGSQSSSPDFAASASVGSSDDSLEISWSGVSANPDSWIGIYSEGDQPGPDAAAAWNYLNGTKSPGGSHPTGKLNFDLPPGEYFAILFSANGYSVEQGPIRLIVVDGEVEPLAVESFVLDQGDYRLRWHSLPGALYDIEVSSDLVEWNPYIPGFRAQATTSSAFIRADKPGNTYFYQVIERAAP